jgi:hypothetical protein
MDIQAKLTGFAMLGATWAMWVLVGLSGDLPHSHQRQDVDEVCGHLETTWKSAATSGGPTKHPVSTVVSDTCTFEVHLG